MTYEFDPSGSPNPNDPFLDIVSGLGLDDPFKNPAHQAPNPWDLLSAEEQAALLQATAGMEDLGELDGPDDAQFQFDSTPRDPSDTPPTGYHLETVLIPGEGTRYVHVRNVPEPQPTEPLDLSGVFSRPSNWRFTTSPETMQRDEAEEPAGFTEGSIVAERIEEYLDSAQTSIEGHRMHVLERKDDPANPVILEVTETDRSKRVAVRNVRVARTTYDGQPATLRESYVRGRDGQSRWHRTLSLDTLPTSDTIEFIDNTDPVLTKGSVTSVHPATMSQVNEVLTVVARLIEEQRP